MKNRYVVLAMFLAAITVSVPLIMTGQQSAQDRPEVVMPPKPASDPDFERSHAPIFSPQDRGQAASRLTESVAAAMPAGASVPVPRKNFIDEHIFGRMERDNIPYAPLAGDDEFVRRAYLDATGMIPTVEETRAFLADKSPDKRDKLIDTLIGSEAFTDQWAYHWGELLRTQQAEFHNLTKRWLKVDRPYNEWFYDLMTPVAKNIGTVAAGMSGVYNSIAYLSNRCTIWTDTDSYKGFNRLDWIDEITSDIGRNFLGVSMDCFSCHNGAGHTDSFNLFLTSMKRTDFAQQAAFFGHLQNIGGSSAAAGANFYGGGSVFNELAPGYVTKDDGPYWSPAENRYPRDGKTHEPAFLLTGEKPRPGENPRKALGRILPTHIQFSRATVNLIWQRLMVIGFVEPYDGFDLLRLDPKNPPPAPWTLQPSNPELLQALAEDFRDNNFSIQRMIKLIMKSSAYQLSTRFEGEWKDTYIPYHARRFARVLSGPEAVDMVAKATAAPFPLTEYGEPRGYIKELTNPNNVRRGGEAGPENAEIFGFMQAFYQNERAMPPLNRDVASPVQAMTVMASPVVAKRVSADGKNRFATLLQSGRSDEEIVEEIYLAALTRLPSLTEMQVAKRVLGGDRRKALEDIQWTVLNSPEFLVNH